MIPTNKPKRGALFARTALGLALSLGAATGAFVAQPAFAQKKAEKPKIEFSPDFAKAAAELDKTLTDAAKSPPAAVAQVKAAGDNAQAKAAAVAQLDTELGGAKAKLDTAAGVATTPGDKLKLGEMTRTYGIMANDIALQHQGLVTMLDSGVVPAEITTQVQWLAGVTAYQKRDYATAARYVQMAKDAGFTDPQLEPVLADAYRRSNNPAAALQNAKQDIAAAKVAGTKPSETSIRTALDVAYTGKQTAEATELAAMLVQNYPSKKSWSDSINIVRQLSSFPAQENLDLMRLKSRTGAMDNRADYQEYLENADPRRLPGEALKTIEAGVASGLLPASDSFVAEARKVASDRLSADRASLPALERDARAASASSATVSGAGDAFLSYGEAAKAESFYTMALGKPGVDTNRVLTRLGIAQLDQGKTAEALANFAKVQGARKPIAQLWSAYASQKAAGGGTAAAAAAPAATAQ